MNRKVLITVSLFLGILLVATLFTTGCSTSSPSSPASSQQQGAQAKELTLVTFLPDFADDVATFLKFIDKLNEQGKGKVNVKFLGGPEVIGEFEQGLAVQKGSVDMSYLPASFYAGVLPVASVVALAEIDSIQQRKSGAYDFLVDRHSKVGIHYLGKVNASTELLFNLMTNKPVSKPQELAGQRFAGGTIWDGILKGLKIESIPIPDAEIYTALERGLIDGYGNPMYVAFALGTYEATKYYVNHSFFLDDAVLIMNQNKWNSLSKDVQDLILNTQLEMETTLAPDFTKIVQKGRQDCMDKGVKPIQFSAADAKWFVDIAYSAEYDRQLKLAPDDVPQLMKMLKK